MELKNQIKMINNNRQSLDTNRQKFLAGKSFHTGHTNDPLFYVASERGGRLDLLTKFGTDYHCNIDKVTRMGIKVYKSIVGRTIYVTIKFADLRFID